jgi:hypothetical protein
MDEADQFVEQFKREHTFQPETAPRQPANKREQAMVDRWVEISARRYETRMSGKERFRYTDGERQLKRRLLKAGLITDIKQPVTSPKKRAENAQRAMLKMAKVFAGKGDVGAIQHVQAVEENRRQKAWMKRQRMLRKLEPRELKDALDDVMATRGLRRPLRKLWDEFVTEFQESSSDRRQAFFVDCPDWVAQAMEVAQAISPAT